MMRLIDRYLLAEGLPALAFGALLYGVLAVVSVTLPRLRWVAGVPVPELSLWLLAQLPTALVQTLPIALVLAVLMAFGRLEGDRELLAMRAGGIPLWRVAAPFLALGAVATVGALASHQWVLPETNAWVAARYWELTANRSGLFRLARQNLPVEGMSLHFDRVLRGGEAMEGVRIERWEDDRLTLVRAERGRFEGTDLVLTGYRTQVLDLAALDALEEAELQRLAEAAGEGGADAPEAQPSVAADRVLRNLVRLDNRPAQADGALRLATNLSPDDLIARFSGGGFEDSRSIGQAARDWRNPELGADERRTAGVLLQRKLAEPFANLVLLLIALPLSLGWARSRGVAFGLSLVVTLAWYLLLTFGQLGAQAGTLPVWLGPWLANLALGALGVWMLIRMRRV